MTDVPLSRRQFLSAATGAMITPILPKQAIAATANAALNSPFARYALETVAGNVLPFFDWGIYFGHKDLVIDTSLFNEEECLDDLVELPLILNPNFHVPRETDQGIVFKMGHLLSEDNISIRQLCAEGNCFSWPGAAEDSLHALRGDLSQFVQNSTQFETLEDLAEIPVYRFYEEFYKPQFKKNLDGLMCGINDVPPEHIDLYGAYLNDVPKQDFEYLKKEYPDCADKLQEMVDAYRFKCELTEKQNGQTREYPVGYLRCVKGKYGMYSLTAPSIL